MLKNAVGVLLGVVLGGCRSNLLNILQIKYWCLPRIHSAGDGAQQPENIKIMQMHPPKPPLLSVRMKY